MAKNIAIALTEAGADVAIVDVDIETAQTTAEELAKKWYQNDSCTGGCDRFCDDECND